MKCAEQTINSFGKNKKADCPQRTIRQFSFAFLLFTCVLPVNLAFLRGVDLREFDAFVKEKNLQIVE